MPSSCCIFWRITNEIITLIQGIVRMISPPMARRDFAAEMRCQLLHDSLYARDGWCRCYVLRLGAAAVGFAGVVVGGPWSRPAPRCGQIRL
jgi:hypothetical protein